MFDPAVREVDLIALSVQVFLPLAFALVLLILPSRFKELLRWWALVGAAATLTLGACRFVDYYALLETYSDRNLASLYHPETRLEARSDRAFADANALPLPKPYRSDDLLTRRPWVSAFNIDYALGIDGISLALVLVTGVVFALAVVASWSVAEHLKWYLALLLVLETGLMGAFLALDLFLLVLFAEAALLPVYFLLNLRGTPEAKAAATKYAWYSRAGSVCLFVALAALYSVNVRDFADPGLVAAHAADLRQLDPALTEAESLDRVTVHTFDIVTLGKAGRAAMLVLTGKDDRVAVRPADGRPPVPTGQAALLAPGTDRAAAVARVKQQSICTPLFQYGVFALLFVGFGVKLAALPLHGWLPTVQAATTTPVSMVVGCVLALGGYGLVRVAVPLAPYAMGSLAVPLGTLGAFAAAFGALAAVGQTDLRKLLAYNSVSLVGLVLLGIAAWGDAAESYTLALSGAVYLLLAHAIGTAGLTFAVGVIEDRTGTRDLGRLGGLRRSMPLFTGVSAVLFFGATALPGLGVFVGVVCILLGAWPWSVGLTIAGAVAAAFGVLRPLKAWQAVFLGSIPHPAGTPDATAREFTVLALFAGLTVFLGVAPMLVFVWLDPSVSGLVDALTKLK
jgi:NADH-quinone oxidoreductase subunit M